MELNIFLKGKKEPIVFKGDRIDLLDIEMNNIRYKQVRVFSKGFSKSQYIDALLIKSIKESK